MIRKLLIALLAACVVQHVATRTVSDVTPNLGALQSIFGQNVLSEIPDDAAAALLTSREWARWETDTTTTKVPFLMCVPSIRESAQNLLGQLSAHIPVIVDANRSCFLAYETRSRVVELITVLPDLEIATPLPSVLKIASGFFDQMNSGAFIDRACQQGIRLTTSPGMDLGSIQDLASSITTDLSSGSYRQELTHFFVPDSPRGQTWQDRIATADLDAKNFTVVVNVEETLLTIRDLCFPETSAYIMALVAYLASLPQLIAVEPSPVIKLNNWNGVGIAQSGTSTLWPLWSAGLRGNGQVAGVSDSGLDINNCYFRQTAGGGGGTTDTSVFGPITIGAFNQKQRKIVQYLSANDGDTSDFLNGHGTHVCGTVVGHIAGSAIGVVNTYTGAAPEGKVAFLDLDDGGGLDIPSLDAVYRAQMRAGARVFSQSWGSGPGTYTARDVLIDRFMYQNPTTITLFSAGNDGDNIGVGSVGRPSISKNAICVGATVVSTTYPNIGLATFSSVGPTRDGRIKPDVVAPGTSTISAAGQTLCGTVSMQGTSMSCPLVAGITLLVRQYFMEGWYPTGVKTSVNRFTPTGALVKAMLVNSAVKVFRYVNISGAVQLLGPPPDMYQGFGQVQMTRVLRLSTAATQPDLFVVNSRAMTDGTVHTYKFTVRSNYIPPASTVALLDAFEATITWMDPNGLANAVKIVLNDLDLVARLDSVPGTLQYPNGRNDADTLNNVEKIRFASPLPGDVITVNVTGTQIVATPTQAYALVASGPFVSAAWFCRDSRANRQDSQWRTEYCPIACTGVFLKSPRCCATSVDGTGGNTCGSSTPSLCTGITTPVECVL